MSPSNRRPNWTLPFVLSIAVVGLGSLAYWLQFKHDPAKEAAATSEKKIVSAPKDAAITQLELSNGTEDFAWKCVGDAGQVCKIGSNSKWQMESPIKVRADDSNVNALVSAVDRLQAADVIDLKDETPEKRALILKEYGLDAIQRSAAKAKKVRIETASSGTWIIYFGNNHPISDGFFTIVQHSDPKSDKVGGKFDNKLDDTRVLVAPSFFKANFDHKLTFWRDKKILTVGASEIASFKIDGRLGPNPKSTWIEGSKTGGAWLLKSPEGEFAGDIESIDSMLTGASFLVAKDILAENKDGPEAKKILKATRPLFTFTLRQAKADPVTIHLFESTHPSAEVPPKAEKEKSFHTEPPGVTGSTLLYATVSNTDPLFELQNSARNQLGKSLKDLRLNKLITSEDRFGAKKIEFSGKPMGDSPVAVTNANGKWVLGTGDADGLMQAMLDKLSGKRIQEFVPAAATPSGEADGLKISLWTEAANGAAPKRQLVFWKKDGKLYARDLLSKRVESFSVDSSVQDALPWSRDFFKAKSQAGEKSAPKSL